MKPGIDAVKKKFREGRHAQAIAECEALAREDPADHDVKRLCATMHGVAGNFGRALELLHQVRDPVREDPDVLFNIGLCERELGNFAAAQEYFRVFTERFPDSPDGWSSLAECRFQLNGFEEGVQLANRAIELDAASVAAWSVLGHCQRSLGRHEQALASYGRANQIRPSGEAFFNAGRVLAEINRTADAIDSFTRAVQLAPNFAPLRVARGDAFQVVGKVREAAADYKAALALAPGDDATLKKATLCLLETGEGEAALELCRDVLRAKPDSLTARLGEEWVLSQLVPLWHIPMMNEPDRNQAYYDGLKSVLAPGQRVFEIGTGSGLTAMMAAKLGAQVVTCEAVGLVASTARKIIRRNRLQDRVTVLAKPSLAVRLGPDLPDKADVLVHEIFSSELLGEHVLPAIEDAKQRLLKPGGVVMPAAASIMIALVGGEQLGRNVFAQDSFGFDLREFNAISPRKRPHYREDLAPVLMSEPLEAFRFDFAGASSFPAQARRIDIVASQAGACHGIIQWIRLDMAEGVRFENHPGRSRPVSNWQHTTYRFDEPMELKEGAVVSVNARHDRSRPWFDLASAAVARPTAGRSG